MLFEEEYRILQNPMRMKQIGVKKYIETTNKEVKAVDLATFKGDREDIEQAIVDMIDRGKLDLSEL
jgi:cobalamin-dependent methionine synthase I